VDDPASGDSLTFAAGSMGEVQSGATLPSPMTSSSGAPSDNMDVMSAKGAPSATSVVPEAKVREQLDRILQSKTFHTVERLKRFFSFVVEETLDGRGDQLKEFVVGIRVFDKESWFDPRNDPIVRVQARRLRARFIPLLSRRRPA